MGICGFREHKARVPQIGKSLNISQVSFSTRLEDIRQHYEFVRVIGYGQFGTVREAVKTQYKEQDLPSSPLRRSISTSTKYAVKSVLKKKVKGDFAMLKTEIELLQSADHPNIIKLYETYEDEKYLHLVMELCTGGDLFDYVISKRHLCEEEVVNIMKKLLSAINYLHTLKICHRDLKPENFLFTTAEPGAELKISDFGLSSKFGGQNGDMMYSMVGTPYYVAPEVIRGTYGKECDIWSLGVVMYFILSGTQPFKSSKIENLFVKILSGDYDFAGKEWESVSHEAKNVIIKMLKVEPAMRPSINMLLKHEWFNKALTDSKTELSMTIIERLQRFKAPSKLWQESMKILVRNLSEEQIEELKTAFLFIDRNNTGRITAQDLINIIREQGYGLARSEINSNFYSRYHSKL